MLDKHEQLTHDGAYQVSILGNPATSDFELIDIFAIPEDISARIASRGLFYIGTVALVNGVPQSALDEPLDPVTIATLAKAYVCHVETAMSAALESSWLQRMYGLPDARAN